ncbi:MAG: class IV adenylate cyclase [Candidatus Heimdallarchaeota archaeon]|nr:class IV adenylate cyclase [Candidatus Heimdallarchaeota archaeon]
MEVEIKIPLKEYFLTYSDAVFYFTETLGSPSEDLYQKDTYFQSPIHNFWQTDEAFRLRETQVSSGSEKIEMTYKGAKIGQSMKIREETTVLISNAKDLKTILHKLGFTSHIVVEKQRINWVRDNFTLSLDQVKDLGIFLELEATIPKEEIDERITDIFQKKVQEILPSWNGNEDRKSYLELLITKEEIDEG